MQHLQFDTPPSSLPALVRDYLRDRPELRPFHSGIPTAEKLIHAALRRNFPPERRKLLAEVLRDQHAHDRVHEAVEDNLRALSDPGSVVIATGHQLCLATGPLYVVWKIMSAISLCRQLNAADAGVRCIPVLWLAGEDHDFDEVSVVHATKGDVHWSRSPGNAVGRMDTEGLMNAVEALCGLWEETERSREVVSLLRKCAEEPYYLGSYRRLMLELFGSFGLVLVDGDDERLKRSFAPLMLRELGDGFASAAVRDTSSRLRELGYEPQVNPRDINLFFFSGDRRLRLVEQSDGRFRAGDSPEMFTRDELAEQIKDSPGRFSPNVILRPLYQEFVLPSIAYVGGPGELSYWLQYRHFFESAEVPFPYLIPRDSAFVLSSRSAERLNRLGLRPEHLYMPREDVIRMIISPEVPDVLAKSRAALDELYETLVAGIRGVDPTLEGAARAEWQRGKASLDQLEKKVLRAIRQKEELRLTQLDRIFSEVFPEGMPQERYRNYLDLVVQTGTWFHTDLPGVFNPLRNCIHVLIP